MVVVVCVWCGPDKYIAVDIGGLTNAFNDTIQSAIIRCVYRKASNLASHSVPF